MPRPPWAAVGQLLQRVPSAPDRSVGPRSGDGPPPVARRGVRVSRLPVSSSQAISIRSQPDRAAVHGQRWQAAAASAAGVPSNFALASSAQSLLNAPGTDAAAAFDEIDRQFHQLPGQGEIITNVSLGDLDDASVVKNFNDPAASMPPFRSTTVMIGGQRYLNWPSMPLIPTYTSNQSGQLSGSGEVCGIDPFLGEVGLDFSMMAPLPTDCSAPARSAQASPTCSGSPRAPATG